MQVTEESRLDPIYKLILVLFGAIGMALCLLSTSKYGAGVTSDSVYYLSTAQNLLRGKFFVTFEDKPYILWPPLFPAVLAFPGLFKLGLESSARIMNSAIYGAVIFLSGLLTARYVSSKVVVLASGAATLLSYAIFSVTSCIWSEPLFILLSLIFFIYAERFMRRGDSSSLFMMTAAAIFAALQRNIGIILIATGFISVLFCGERSRLKERLKLGTLFSIAAMLPFSLWVLRGYILADAATEIPPPIYSLGRNITSSFRVLSSWLVPVNIPFGYRMTIVLSLGAAIAGLLVSLRRKLGTDIIVERRILPLIVFPLLLVAFVIFMKSFVTITSISDRMFSPAFVPFACLAFIFAGKLLDVTGRLEPGRASFIKVVLLLFFMTWTWQSAARISQEAQAMLAYGTGEYTTDICQRSQLMRWLKKYRTSGKIYSNAMPDAIYYMTGKLSARIPSKLEAIKKGGVPDTKVREDYSARVDAIREELKAGSGILLWFDTVYHWSFPKEDELKKLLNLKLSLKLADGSVYMINNQFPR